MDNLVDFLVWAFTLLGLTTIITKSNILAGFRGFVEKINSFLGKMIICPPCFGFWGGLILSCFYKTITGNILLDAILGSGLIFYITYTPEYEPSYSKPGCSSCGDNEKE